MAPPRQCIICKQIDPYGNVVCAACMDEYSGTEEGRQFLSDKIREDAQRLVRGQKRDIDE